MIEPTEILASFHANEYVYEYLFPFPLADLYRRYRMSRGVVDRLAYLLAAGEASLKFLSSLALAMRYQDQDLADRLKEVQPALAAPSFGTWRHLLEALVPSVTVPVTFLEQSLAGCVRDSHGNCAEYLKSVQTVIEQRNIYVHGGVMTIAVAEKTLEAVLPSFRRAFRELSFLGHCSFVVCEEVRRIRRPQCFEAVVRLCRGCNPVFPYEIWQLDEPIDPQIPLLVTPNLSLAYSLHPLVALLPHETAGGLRCYFYCHRKRQTMWQTYEMAHDNLRAGDAGAEEEMVSFLEGNFQPAAYALKFHGGIQPAWSISLHDETKVDAPPGYTILGRIGEGRYATVSRVVHTGMQETRAFKVLRPECAHDARIRKRFEIEAQAISKLRGKGVAIDLHEYGETPNGLPYLVMQFVQEGSLDEAMKRWGPKGWQEVLEIGIKCFRGLKTIHEVGLLHRDIKLSNLLVAGDSFLFCDFGEGKFIEDNRHLTIDGDAIGTLVYMAPEQQEGHASVQSDIYSLGVCLIELLAGRNLTKPGKWLYREYSGSDEFQKALLGFIEPIPENRPLSAAAALERLAGIRERARRNQPSVEVAIVANALQPVRRDVSRSQRMWTSPNGTLFREIPAGQVILGGTKYADERPVHHVTFTQPFFLAAVPVTNRQFAEFWRATRYRGLHRNFLLHLRKEFFEPIWKQPDQPVVFVSWVDAKEYVLWLCEQDDRDYYLPTEAQWEYACRAGSRTVYPWGNTYDPALLNADNVHDHPTPVGTYPPNAWGLFDMLGNVWEWCEDVKDVITREESIFYRVCAHLPENECVNPVNSDPDPIVSRRVVLGERVVRGGSFFSEGRNFRPANRRGQAQDTCVRSIGFRLALRSVPTDELVESPAHRRQSK